MSSSPSQSKTSTPRRTGWVHNLAKAYQTHDVIAFQSTRGQSSSSYNGRYQIPPNPLSKSNKKTEQPKEYTESVMSSSSMGSDWEKPLVGKKDTGKKVSGKKASVNEVLSRSAVRAPWN